MPIKADKKLGSRYSNYHQVTKDEIRKFITLWETATPEDVMGELNLNKQQVQYIATQIRKAGYKLPHKKTRGKFQSLIKETLVEDKLITKKQAGLV